MPVNEKLIEAALKAKRDCDMAETVFDNSKKIFRDAKLVLLREFTAEGIRSLTTPSPNKSTIYIRDNIHPKYEEDRLEDIAREISARFQTPLDDVIKRTLSVTDTRKLVKDCIEKGVALPEGLDFYSEQTLIIS